MTNPSTRCVRTCRPSGHAFGSQAPLSLPKLWGSGSDRLRGSVSGGGCGGPDGQLSTF